MKRRVIWKYPLGLEMRQTVLLPTGYSFLTVQMQNGQITLWCEVDPDEEEKVGIDIVIIGTGMEYGAEDGTGMRYLGTVQNAGYVWHVFQEWKSGRI